MNPYRRSQVSYQETSTPVPSDRIPRNSQVSQVTSNYRRIRSLETGLKHYKFDNVDPLSPKSRKYPTGETTSNLGSIATLDQTDHRCGKVSFREEKTMFLKGIFGLHDLVLNFTKLSSIKFPRCSD